MTRTMIIRRRTQRRTLAALALALLLPACAATEAGEPGDDAGSAALHELVVRTFDHGFQAPASVPAGPTRVRLINDGPDFHHVWLVRLDGDVDVDELAARLSAHGHPPAGAVAVGGPNTPGAPGAETTAIVDLRAGEYVMVCVIPGMEDGELHVAKGMVARLTVTPSATTAAMPSPALVMTLDDYSFALNAPITPGRHDIRVVNAAVQAHEVVVVRLEPGRTAHDFLAFLQRPEGEPPGVMIGGTTWLDRGEANVVTLDFEPGEYALLCFVPDAADGRLHLAHGMVRQLRVE